MKFFLIFFSLTLLTGCSAQNLKPETQNLNDCSTIRFDSTYVSNTKNFVMPCLGGTSSFDLKSLRGPTIINVWGSWCLGCREEMPYFVDLYNNSKFTQSQVQLIGVDVAETNFAAGADFAMNNKMSWPNLADINNKSKLLFGMGVPVTWFIDEKGSVIYQRIGAYPDKKTLFNDVKKYFKVNF